MMNKLVLSFLGCRIHPGSSTFFLEFDGIFFSIKLVTFYFIQNSEIKNKQSFDKIPVLAMGRRGKAKKQSTNAARDDAASGEEENIPVRRRGRPQKPLKDEIDEEEIEKIEEEESESAKSSVSNKDVKKQSAAENGRKRKRASQAKENPDSVKEENGVGSKTDGLKAVGFRQNGSRRKNKPRRAAEVGVECK